MTRRPKKAEITPAPAPPLTADVLQDILAKAVHDPSNEAGSEVLVPRGLLADAIRGLRRREVLPIPEELLSDWDKVSGAIDAIVCALPSQMTDCAARLEETRRAYRVTVQRAAMNVGVKRKD